MKEENIPEIIIQHAILHILDYNTGINVSSEEELDLSDTPTYGYLLKHIYHLLEDSAKQSVVFEEDSTFRSTIMDYKRSQIDFHDCSVSLLNLLDAWFKEHPDLQSLDVIFLDYTLNTHPYFGMLVLENSEAWTHATDNAEGKLINRIVKAHTVLPSASKKISTYALISLEDGGIDLSDKLKTGASKDPHILTQVLQCTQAKSADEVVKIVKKAVSEAAEQHGELPAVSLSRAKKFIQDNYQTSDELNPKELGEEIFHEQPELQEVYNSIIEEAVLPEKVEMPEPAVKRNSRQKMKTDTGIEISAPVEYFSNPDYMEIERHPDGTITIELKNIAKITQRI